LAVFGAVVGLACLLAQIHPTVPTHWIVTAMAALFAGYGLIALTSPWLQGTARDLLALIGETIFFLVFAHFGGEGGSWLSTILYFHLMLRTMLLHEWWDTWLVVVVTNGFLAVVSTARTQDLWQSVVWMGLLSGVWALHNSRLRAEAAKSSQQAQQFHELAESSRNDERNKLAGDFHDGPMQAFISLQMRLEVLRKLMERDPVTARQELGALQELFRSQIAEMRAFLRGIRPAVVGEAGLVASLRQTVAEFEKHSGIPATFQCHSTPVLESPEASLESVHILHESLTNIRKHSRATHAAVTVRGSRGQLEICVEDNGVGFPFSGAYSLEELEQLRLGPSSIRRRVRALGGKLALESRPERGSMVSVRIDA